MNEALAAHEREFFIERMGVRIPNNGYAFYAVVNAVDRIGKENRELSGQQLTTIGQRALDYFYKGANTFYPDSSAVDSSISSMVSREFPSAEPITPVFIHLFQDLVRAQLNDMYQPDMNAIHSSFLENGASDFGQIFDDGRKYPALKEAFDNLFLNQYQLKPDDRPDLVHDYLLDSAKANTLILKNGLPTDNHQLNQQLPAYLITQGHKIDEIRIEMEKTRDRARTQQLEEELNKQIAEERAGAFLITTALSFGDAKLSRTFSTLANTFINVQQTQALAAIGKVGTLGLTAGYVGAGLALASLLTSSGSGDEAILGAIQALAHQMEQMRREMHERFDHIDETLNRIYGETIAGFNNLALKVAQAREGILALQEQLLEIEDELGEIDRRSQSYSQSLSQQLTNAKLGNCLSGALPSSVHEFSECIEGFVTTATVTSRSSVWSTSSDLPSDNINALGDLNRPPEQSISLLGKLAATNYGQPIGVSVNVPNPVVWATAARGYLNLIAGYGPGVSSTDSPSGRAGSDLTIKELASGPGPTRKLIASGNEIREAIKTLGSSRGKSKNRAGVTILDAVFNEFQDNVNNVDADVAALEKEYETTQASGYDLWGDVNQHNSLADPPAWKKANQQGGPTFDAVQDLAPCTPADDFLNGAHQELPHTGIIPQIIPQVYRMADELRLGTIFVCYSNPMWTNGVHPPGRPEMWKEQMSTDIEVRFTLSASVLEEMKKASKAKAASKRSGSHAKTTLPAESESINSTLIAAHRRDVPPNKYWDFDCRELVPGTILVLAPEKMPPLVGQCMQQGPPLQYLKVKINHPDQPSPFTDFWHGCNGDQHWGCLVSNYSPSAAEQEPDRVSKDLVLITSLVQQNLAEHRRNLAGQVAKAMFGRVPEDSQFVAQNKVRIAKDFREIETLSAVVNLYAGLLLSQSMRTNDRVMSSLLAIKPERWAARLQTAINKSMPQANDLGPAKSHLLATLHLNDKTASARHVLDTQLRSGAESYDLVESTLNSLHNLEYIQIVQSLPPSHVCFRNPGLTLTPPADVHSQIPWPDVDVHRISKIDLTMQITTAKDGVGPGSNFVVSNNGLLLTGMTHNGSDGKMQELSFSGEGLTAKGLADSTIKLCMGPELTHDSADISNLAIDIEDDSGQKLSYARWEHVTVAPAEQGVAIILQSAPPPAMPSTH